jgi:hypothetical protein
MMTLGRLWVRWMVIGVGVRIKIVTDTRARGIMPACRTEHLLKTIVVSFIINYNSATEIKYNVIYSLSMVSFLYFSLSLLFVLL